MTSSFKQIISQLEQQRTAIDRAIAALQEVGDEGSEQSQQTRPTAERTSGGAGAKKGSKKKAGGKRTLSPEARERIAEAQRQRWAAAKRASKKQAANKNRYPLNTTSAAPLQASRFCPYSKVTRH
jgi:ABC-type transporter Mla subunit MlaD